MGTAQIVFAPVSSHNPWRRAETVQVMSSAFFIPEEECPSEEAPAGVEEDADMPMASASLVAYCSELAAHRNPTQFGTSVPGGCWSSPQQASADEFSDSIPIFRV